MQRAHPPHQHLKPKVVRLTGYDALRQISPKLARVLKRALDATEAGDLVAALTHFEQAARLDPTNKAVLYFGQEAVARFYFGHKASGQYEREPEKLAQARDAAWTLTEAMALAYPDDPKALHNAGRFLHDDGHDGDAIPWYRQALKLDPSQVESWGNLGTVYASLGRAAEAETCWSRCVAFDAVNPSGHLAQSYVWLRRGDYARGWRALNARWADQTFQGTYGRKDLRGKPWMGQPLRRGESVLLHGEQGLGDHVQFARYVPVLCEHLAATGATVAAVETRSQLLRWMQGALPGVPVVVRDSALPPYTHHAPLMSLPGLLPNPERVPPAVTPFRYMSPETRAVRRIGLVWYGAAGNMADRERSIPHSELRHLADTPGVQWVPLQYDPTGTAAMLARAWLGSGVDQTPPTYDDALGLAEVLTTLDGMVTVDTLAAHVAGALGIPTLLLHRHSREWRWGQHTTDTPWYPSVTMLTCPAPHAWVPVLQQARQLLSTGS